MGELGILNMKEYVGNMKKYEEIYPPYTDRGIEKFPSLKPKDSHPFLLYRLLGARKFSKSHG